MTPQEIFDLVTEKLYAQEVPSINFRDDCLYRSPCGKRCAVGWLVTEDAYLDRMEGKGVNSSTVTNVLRNSGIPIDEPTLSLLADLQQAHDTSLKASLSDWIEAMRRIAITHQLLLPEVLLPTADEE